MIPPLENWDLSEIAVMDEARAERLSTPSAPDLKDAIVEVLKKDSAGVQLGWEFGDKEPTHPRAVVQFPIPPEVFDVFMNGRAGYRARYAVSPENGRDYNAVLVEAIIETLWVMLLPVVKALAIGPGFVITGEVEVPRQEFLRSLEPALSKVWMATALMGVAVDIPSGFDAPRIAVPDRAPWRTFVRDAATAWLDVKGGFLGPDGPYQVKPMSVRNERLWRTGEA